MQRRPLFLHFGALLLLGHSLVWHIRDSSVKVKTGDTADFTGKIADVRING